MPMPWNLSFKPIDIAIDFGTFKTAVFVRGEGQVFEDITATCFKMRASGRRELVRVGAEAEVLAGREPHGLQVLRPLESGVITDLSAACSMLSAIGRQLKVHLSLRKPRILIAAPCGCSGMELLSFRKAAESLGSDQILVVEEPLAAALGADLDVTDGHSHMVVDIGGGISELVLISMGTILHSESLRVGCDAINDALVRLIKDEHHLLIGRHSAESLKRQVIASQSLVTPSLWVKGTDTRTRMPAIRNIDVQTLRSVLTRPVQAITEMIKTALEKSGPQVRGNLIEDGIVVTGGGALLEELPYLLEQSLGLPIKVARDPLRATVRGVGIMLNEMKTLQKIMSRK